MSLLTNRPYHRTNNRIPAGDSNALEANLRLYADADVVLSSALHGCIIAVAMGCKILAVSGDYKVESFMDAAGLSEWVCDIEEVDSLTDLLKNLHSQSIPNEFVTWASNQNRLVAGRMRKAMVISGGMVI
jgi:polysaccharide pyruvyl transferase WcaK-like protein